MINMYLPTILFYFTTAISENYGENLEFKQDQGLFFFRFFFFFLYDFPSAAQMQYSTLAVSGS